MIVSSPPLPLFADRSPPQFDMMIIREILLFIYADYRWENVVKILNVFIFLSSILVYVALQTVYYFNDYIYAHVQFLPILMVYFHYSALI